MSAGPGCREFEGSGVDVRSFSSDALSRRGLPGNQPREGENHISSRAPLASWNASEGTVLTGLGIQTAVGVGRCDLLLIKCPHRIKIADRDWQELSELTGGRGPRIVELLPCGSVRRSARERPAANFFHTTTAWHLPDRSSPCTVGDVQRDANAPHGPVIGAPAPGRYLRMFASVRWV